MKKNYLTFLLPLFLSHLLAQTITVSGKVVDTNNNPIENVNVYTDSQGTSTDTLGTFRLVCNQNDLITLSHIAYNDISVLTNKIPPEIILSLHRIKSDEVIVIGGSFGRSLKETNTSLSLIQSNEISDGRYQHFEDVISLIPNLNFSGATSRPRYFQIRGIGELSQFSGEGAPHFYVGFIMDDIDLSGIGMGSLMNDVKQIEVFKGPQSVVFGPNSMAGLINISSNEPTPYTSGSASISLNNDNGYLLSGSYSKPLSKHILLRSSVVKHSSDGFRTNKYFNISNTNKKDETLFRVKLFINPINRLKIKLTTYRIDIKNGYDIWTPDNNGFITYSDYKGIDSQITNACAIRSNYITPILGVPSNFLSISTFSRNDMKYSYDGDWGNLDFWEENYQWFEASLDYPALGFPDNYYPYKFEDETIRNRQTTTQEIRMARGSEVLGVYYSNVIESDDRNGWLFGGRADSLHSKFIINTLAGYFATKFSIFNKIRLGFNFRIEANTIKDTFSASLYGIDKPGFEDETSDILFGNRIELDYKPHRKILYSISLSRGYKTSGINQSPNIGIIENLGDELRKYKSEYVYNAEGALKFEDESRNLSLSIFYMHRDNPQVRLSYQLDPDDPTSFDYYTVNAHSGYSYGIESQIKLAVFTGLYFYDNFSILKSHISKYQFLDNTIGDREPAHAPALMSSAGLEYSLSSGLYFKIDHSYMSSFYFEDQYDIKSEPQQIINSTVGVKRNGFHLSAWLKNMLDEKHITRGYYFVLEPTPGPSPNFSKKSYQSYANPLNMGITLSYSF